MCTRGIYQLKNIKLNFCDWGGSNFYVFKILNLILGSSKGTREFLKSVFLKDFIDKNPQISIDFILRRGSHPYICSTYINGYEKNQSLRNLKPEEILNEFQRVRKSFGRKHLPHAGKKVHGIVKSIQGGWKPNMWKDYPKHEFEKVKIIPPFEGLLVSTPNRKYTDPYAVYHKDYTEAQFKQKPIDEAL